MTNPVSILYFLLFVGYFSPWLCVILHFSPSRPIWWYHISKHSKHFWSTFQVSTFQHHTQLCSKCSTLVVPVSSCQIASTPCTNLLTEACCRRGGISSLWIVLRAFVNPQRPTFLGICSLQLQNVHDSKTGTVNHIAVIRRRLNEVTIEWVVSWIVCEPCINWRYSFGPNGKNF